MEARNGSPDAAGAYRVTDRLILGMVLAVITFWLFAQTTLNVAPAMRSELRISEGMSNLAVSITALFSGIFIVVRRPTSARQEAFRWAGASCSPRPRGRGGPSRRGR